MLASCVNCGTKVPGDALYDHVAERLVARVGNQEISCEDITRCAAEVGEVVSVDRVKRFQSAREKVTDTVYAVHEAAHAVVGTVLGLGVRSVNIDGAVCCHFEPREIDPIADALTSLAGPATERRKQRIRLVGVRSLRACAEMVRINGGNSCDACQAMRKIGTAHPHSTDDERLAIYEDLQDRALGLVRRHSDAIDRVAAALIERGHLSGVGVRSLMESKK